MKKFKIISRDLVLNNQWMPVEKQIVELPNGKMTEWFVNQCSDAVIVIPILKDGSVLLQKNYKHGCGEFIYEFCAGMIDGDELPKIAAARELLEETGYSGDLVKLKQAFSNPTGSIMRYHYFLAKNCEKVSEQNLEDAEQIELVICENLKEAKKLLLDPVNYTSSATLSALMLVEAYSSRF